MKKIKKLVAIQPVSILEESKEKLKEFCEEIIFFDSQPESAEEIVEITDDGCGICQLYTCNRGGNLSKVSESCIHWDVLQSVFRGKF